MLVGRTHLARDRVGAGVKRGGVGPLVGALSGGQVTRRALFLAWDRRHTPTSIGGRPQGPPPRIHSAPAPTRPSAFPSGFTENLPVKGNRAWGTGIALSK